MDSRHSYRCDYIQKDASTCGLPCARAQCGKHYNKRPYVKCLGTCGGVTQGKFGYCTACGVLARKYARSDGTSLVEIKRPPSAFLVEYTAELEDKLIGNAFNPVTERDVESKMSTPPLSPPKVRELSEYSLQELFTLQKEQYEYSQKINAMVQETIQKQQTSQKALTSSGRIVIKP